jgi:hypothetical protein
MPACCICSALSCPAASATLAGNLALFASQRRQRRHWDSIVGTITYNDCQIQPALARHAQLRHAEMWARTAGNLQHFSLLDPPPLNNVAFAGITLVLSA